LKLHKDGAYALKHVGAFTTYKILLIYVYVCMCMYVCMYVCVCVFCAIVGLDNK